jgi:hypothetical protein
VPSTLFTSHNVAVATPGNVLPVPYIADLTLVSFAAIVLLSLPATRMVALMICLKFLSDLHHTTVTFRGGHRMIYPPIKDLFSSNE